MPNHGTRILGRTCLIMVFQSIHKNNLGIPNIFRFKYPMITALPPQDLQKTVQTTEPDRNHENHADEIPKQISEDDQNTQETQKASYNPSEDDIQKTPENSQNTPLQEEPMNTRGEKYNLRPNPNLNYSDSYRYWKRNAGEIFLLLSPFFPDFHTSVSSHIFLPFTVN